MRLKKILKISGFLSWFLFFIITPLFLINLSSVAAADTIKFQPQITVPGSIFKSTASTTITNSSLSLYIKAFYDYGMTIAGILAALVLMGGGILWLTSAGNDTKITKARELIIGSIAGLIVLFSSWIILNTINPDLINLKALDIESLELKKQEMNVYSKEAQYDKKFASSEAGGTNHCCVIKGELDGSGWIDDTTIIRCASYSLKTEKAEKECTKFYNNYIEQSSGLMLENLIKTKTFNSPVNDVNLSYLEKNYASVFIGGACWDFTGLKGPCQAKDAANFCEGRKNESKCLLPGSHKPGYCLDGVCKGANEAWLWEKLTNGSWCYSTSTESGYVKDNECLKCKPINKDCLKSYECCSNNCKNTGSTDENGDDIYKCK